MSYRIFPDGKYGEATEAVYDEIIRAIAKHPQTTPFHSTHEGFGILKEEVDEMWEDIKKDNINLTVKEAVQVAAMAIRFVAEFGKYPYSIHPSTSSNFESNSNPLQNLNDRLK